MKVVKNNRLVDMLIEEIKSGEQYIELDGQKESDGFLYSYWSDNSTGMSFATKKIFGRLLHEE